MTRLHARAVLDYPLVAPATDGSVVEVAPGILWARMPMPMALDHINVYLLRGDDGWTLIDTGLNTDTARERWEHIAAHHLQGLPIVRLVCTHMHYDHAGLASWLCERFGIPLYMTHGEYFMMRTLAEPPLARWRRHRTGWTGVARGHWRRPFARTCLPVLRARRNFDCRRPAAAAHQLQRAGHWH